MYYVNTAGPSAVSALQCEEPRIAARLLQILNKNSISDVGIDIIQTTKFSLSVLRVGHWTYLWMHLLVRCDKSTDYQRMLNAILLTRSISYLAVNKKRVHSARSNKIS